MSKNQRKVLEFLSEHGDHEGRCFYFRTIAKGTKLTIRECRLACRALARKGFAEFHRGLFDDDGMAAGSGYCATTKGEALISPCDVCGKLARYDYSVDKDGKQVWLEKENIVSRILECEQHYKKSPKLK